MHFILQNSIYVTGHSLGGAEAQYVAYMKPAVAGGITFGAPGIPPYAGSNANANVSNVYNYVDYGDPVGNYASDSYSAYSAYSLTGFHYGNVVLVGSNSNTVPPFTAVLEVLSEDVPLHSLTNYARDLALSLTNSFQTVDTVLDNINSATVLTTSATGTINSEPKVGSTASVSDGQGGLVDKDWFKVTLLKDHTYSIQGSSTSIDTGLVDLALYDENGNLVTGIYDNGSNQYVEGASPSFTIDTSSQSSASQDYYVAVNAGGSEPAWRTAIGDYTLSLSDNTQAVNHAPTAQANDQLNQSPGQ